MEAFKNQFMTISALNATQNKDSGGLYTMLYTFLVITITDYFFSSVMPAIKDFIKTLMNLFLEYLKDKIKKNSKNILTPVSKVLTKQSSIYFRRAYKNDNKSNFIDNEICDSLIHLISSLDQSKSVEYNRFYFVNHTEPIDINNDISVKIVKINQSNEGEITGIDFELYSYTLKLKELHEFVDKVVHDYTLNKQNKLGNKLYYFNEKVKILPRDSTGNIVWRLASERLTFDMSPFVTNKTLDNIFGESMEIVRNRVNFFINNKKWYEDKGIPYNLGILMYGVSGAGKTSLCKAIANVTKRHIISISLNECTTKTQLHKLFFEEKLVIDKGDGQLENLSIPIDKRLYVFEDIDCLSEIILDRKLKTEKNCNELTSVTKIDNCSLKLSTGYSDNSDDDYIDFKTSKNSSSKIDNQNGNEEKLNLSFLLNLFDGILETNNRIMIFSTNMPEKLDHALIRPGRIDVKVEFKKCSKRTIREMLIKFYDISEKEVENYEFIEDNWTPAELYEILFKYKEDYKEAIKELIKLT